MIVESRLLPTFEDRPKTAVGRRYILKERLLLGIRRAAINHKERLIDIHYWT